MNTVEASGRSVEEAVRAAAQRLGVGVDRVDYEVVDEGTRGFLGIGQTPAVVRAWLRQHSAPAPEVEQRAAEVEEAVPPSEEVSPAAQEAEFGQAAEEEIEEAAEEPAAEEQTAEMDQVAQDAAGQDFEEALMGLLTELISAMKLDAKPVLRSSDSEEATVELVGPDVAILIGKHGQTLDALQYLVGIIVNRSVPAKKRVILDAEGYRERHRRLLEEKAREYADAVRREGKEAVLEPQPARDRRVIHLALANDPDVYTYSEGEGEERHVVISPKK